MSSLGRELVDPPLGQMSQPHIEADGPSPGTDVPAPPHNQTLG